MTAQAEGTQPINLSHATHSDQLGRPAAVRTLINRLRRLRVRLETDRLLNPLSRERRLAIHRVTTGVAEAAFDPGGGTLGVMADAVVAGDVAELEIAALEQARVLRVVVRRAGLSAAEGDAGGFGGFGSGDVVAVVAVVGGGESRFYFGNVVSV